MRQGSEMVKLNNKGFSLAELLVVMAIFIVVMVMITTSFDNILKRTGQQIKGATTDTQGLVGLELLRSDLENAGFGLPWSFTVTPTAAFTETTATPVTGITSSSFNDITPRALAVGYAPAGSAMLNGAVNSTNPKTAYLVIKATNIANNDTGKRWSYVNYEATTTAGVTSNSSYIYPWPTTSDNFDPNARLITINSTFTTAGLPDKRLAMDSSSPTPSFFYRIGTAPSYSPLVKVVPPSDFFKPSDASQLFLVYGVDSGSDLRMPYNRADYYVKKAATMPASCNPGTGILYKGVVQQQDGAFVEYPLLICVGDMQVEFKFVDPQNDANVRYSPTLTGSNGVTPLSAEDIRNQLKEVRVYILSHEGRKDTGYSYSADTPAGALQVGDPSRSSSSGRMWQASEMQNSFGADWRNYRWKVRTIVVQPKNLD
jgi:prepilin-type N-terminal cleavage/methylation domain-containing protein